jgi:hypothetical protein
LRAIGWSGGKVFGELEVLRERSIGGDWAAISHETPTAVIEIAVNMPLMAKSCHDL